MSQIITDYHHTVLFHKSRIDAVGRVCQALAKYPQEVGIVCTGLSGILVAVPAAEKTDRKFAIVRKRSETTHSFKIIEGYTLDKYVIVDDFICQGSTIRRILREIHQQPHMSVKPICCGIILYRGADSPYGNYNNIFDGHPVQKQHIPIIIA